MSFFTLAAPWYQPYVVNGTAPSVALDFTIGRYYDGTGDTILSSLVSGSPTVTPGSGMLCNSTSITATGALLTAMKGSAITIRVDTAGGTNFQNAGIVTWDSVNAPLFQTLLNTARTYKNTGTVSLDTTNRSNWVSSRTSVVSLNSSARWISLDNILVSADAAALAVPTTVTLGSFNGGSLFGGYIKRIFVYPRFFTNAELTVGRPRPYAGSNAIYFQQSINENTIVINNTFPYVSAGSQAALQWERTQPWSCISAINCPVPPPAAGAAIIFTTSNQGSGTLFTGYELWVDPSGLLRVRIINNFGTSNLIDIQGSTNVCDGITKVVAATYDGSSTAAGVKLYVNGIAETITVNTDGLSGSIVNSMPFTIGNQNGFPYSFGGMIDEFYLTKGVLSQTSIANFSSASIQSTIDGNNSMLAYGFNEGSGTIASDFSTNNFTGTLSSTPAPVWI